MGRSHRAVYRLSRGRLLGHVAGMPVLLLTTTGRRSGRARTTPLTYFEDGDELVIVASNGGEDSPPAWWLNLLQQPEASVTIGSRSQRGDCARRDAPRSTRASGRTSPPTHAGYAAYARRTARPIPVVLLSWATTADQRKCTGSVAPSSSNPTNRRLRFSCSGGLQPQAPRARCKGEDRDRRPAEDKGAAKPKSANCGEIVRTPGAPGPIATREPMSITIRAGLSSRVTRNGCSPSTPIAHVRTASKPPVRTSSTTAVRLGREAGRPRVGARRRLLREVGVEGRLHSHAEDRAARRPRPRRPNRPLGPAGRRSARRSPERRCGTRRRPGRTPRDARRGRP